MKYLIANFVVLSALVASFCLGRATVQTPQTASIECRPDGLTVTGDLDLSSPFGQTFAYDDLRDGGLLLGGFVLISCPPPVEGWDR